MVRINGMSRQLILLGIFVHIGNLGILAQETPRFCPGKVNLVIAMDASQSLSDSQFGMIANYTTELIKLFNVGSGANVSVIAFSQFAEDVSLYKPNVDEIEKDVRDYAKNRNQLMFTNINRAIDRTTSILNAIDTHYVNGTRDVCGVPKVGIILTDGKATTPVVAAAKSAADSCVTILAVGVANISVHIGYVKSQLLEITNYRTENVVESSFLTLTTETLTATVKRTCSISEMGGEFTYCNSFGNLGIGVHVTKISEQHRNNLRAAYLNVLLNMFALNDGDGDMKVTIANGEHTLVKLKSKEKAQSELLTLGSSNALPYYDNHTTADMLTTVMDNLAEGSLNRRRIILLIIDSINSGTQGSDDALRSEIQRANANNIPVIILAIGMANQNDVNRLNTVLGGTQNRILVSPSLFTIMSSGFNQVINRLCAVNGVAKLPTVPMFQGPADLHFTLDVCDDTPFIRHSSEDGYLRFLSNVASNINMSAVTFSASLTTCGGVEYITNSRNYIYGLVLHRSLAFHNQASHGVSGTVSTAQLLKSVIDVYSGSPGNAAILFITDATPEAELRRLAYDVLVNHRIYLFPIGLYTSESNNTIALQQKLYSISQQYTMLSIDELNPTKFSSILQPFLAMVSNRRLQLMLGMADHTNAFGSNPVHVLKLDNFVSYVQYILRTLQSTAALTLQEQINMAKADIEAVSPNSALHLNKSLEFIKGQASRYDFAILITDQVLKRNLTTIGGITIALTGWRKRPGIGTGPLNSTEIENKIRDLQIGNTLVLIDSTDHVTYQEFQDAKSFAADLISRLSDVIAKIEVYTYADYFQKVVDLQVVSNNDDWKIQLSNSPHLMTLAPVYELINLLGSLTAKSALHRNSSYNVQTLGIVFINSNIRYPEISAAIRNNDLYKDLSLILIDISSNGDLNLDSLAISNDIIIRLKDVDINNLANALLGLIALNYASNSNGAITGYQLILALDMLKDIPISMNDLGQFLQTLVDGVQTSELGLVLMDGVQMDSHLFLTLDNIINYIKEFRDKQTDDVEKSINNAVWDIMDALQSYNIPKIRTGTIFTDKPPAFPLHIQNLAVSALDDKGINLLGVGYGNPKPSISSLESITIGNTERLFVTDSEDELASSGARWFIKTVSDIVPTILTTTTTTTMSTTTTTGPTSTNSTSSSTLSTSTSTMPSTTIVPPECHAEIHIYIAMATERPDVSAENILAIIKHILVEMGESKSHTVHLVQPEFRVHSQKNVVRSSDDQLISLLEQIIKLVEENSKYQFATKDTECVAILITDKFSSEEGLSQKCFDDIAGSRLSYVVVSVDGLSNKAQVDIARLVHEDPSRLIEINAPQDLQGELVTSVCKAAVPQRSFNITKICIERAPRNTALSKEMHFLPYPYDCEKFIVCMREGDFHYAKLSLCPPTYTWNKYESKCDYTPGTSYEKCSLEGLPWYSSAFGGLITSSLNYVDPANKMTQLQVNQYCDRICNSTKSQNQGFGYGAYPYDCGHFILCTRYGNVFTGSIKTCALGLFWDPVHGGCKHPEIAKCETDPCKTSVINRKVKMVACNMFHECLGQITHLKMCPAGQIFKDNKCSPDDKQECTDPPVHVSECHRTTGSMSKTYIDLDNPFKELNCPCGKEFTANSCNCSRRLDNQNCDPCTAVYRNDFGGHPETINNVQVGFGIAGFQGNGFLKTPVIEQNIMANTFLISLKVVATAELSESVLLRTCSDMKDLSLTLLIQNDKLELKTPIPGQDSISVSFQRNKQQDIVLAFQNEKLILKKSNHEISEITGVGLGGFCLKDVVLGEGKLPTGEGFIGHVDEIAVHKCIPREYQYIFESKK